jgi:hypothetical protein
LGSGASSHASCTGFYPALTDVTGSDDAGERAVTGGDVLAEANTRAALAEARLSDLKAMLNDMRGGVEDLKRDRDEWRAQAQALRLALPKPESAPVSWWRWLRATA